MMGAAGPILPPADPEPDPGFPGYPIPNPDDDPDVVPETDPPTTPFQI
jgi:hypothetical protein